MCDKRERKGKPITDGAATLSRGMTRLGAGKEARLTVDSRYERQHRWKEGI